MTVFYNIALLLGLFVGLLPLGLYLLVVKKARAGFLQKLGQYPKEIHEKLKLKNKQVQRIWFHAVSVGEFNAIRPLVDSLMQGDNALEVVISTTTETGQNLAKQVYKNQSLVTVVYYPYDLVSAVSSAHQLIQPDLVVVAETEIWPNFMALTTDRFQTPLLFINGRISPKSYTGYQRFSFFFKPFLNAVTHFYMQSSADAVRIKEMGALSDEKVTVAGNLKFDISPEVDEAIFSKLSLLTGFSKSNTVLTFASTHSGEDRLFVQTFQRLKTTFPELKAILAPRHPERRQEIVEILNQSDLPHRLRSKLADDKPNQTDFVVLDSIGELMAAYQFSKLAVMGGSFIDRGGQNPLEPLSLGVPVVFGSSMTNFKAISEAVLSAGCGVQVGDKTGLDQAVTQYLTTPEDYQAAVSNASDLMQQNQGAKKVLLEAIYTFLK